MDEGFRGGGRSGGSDVPVRSRGSGSGGGGGWPLGLPPLHAMSGLAAAAAAAASNRRRREVQLFHVLPYSRRNHHRHAPGVGPEASPFLLSTSSFSSVSSSDLDTESTGSFFPEQSTTLGTLIGINNPGRAGRMAHRRQAPDQQPLVCHTKHYGQAPERLQACWCTTFTVLLKCASSHCHSDPISHDSSLAHLLELERRAAKPPPECVNPAV